MNKVISVALLVALVGAAHVYADDDVVTSATGSGCPCQCILPVVILPGGGAGLGGLPPSVLQSLIGGGILNGGILNGAKLEALNYLLSNGLLNNIINRSSGNSGLPLNSLPTGNALPTGTVSSLTSASDPILRYLSMTKAGNYNGIANGLTLLGQSNQ